MARARSRPTSQPKRGSPAAKALDELEASVARGARAAERVATRVLPLLRTQTQRKRATAILLGLGTDRATELALELLLAGRFPITLERDALVRVWRALAARLAELDLASDRITYDLALGDALALDELPIEIRRELARATVAAGDRMRPDLHDQATRLVWTLADDEERARLLSDDGGLPFAYRVQVLLEAEPARAYDALVEDFRHRPECRAAILASLDQRADVRWVHEVLAVADWDPLAITNTLAALHAAEELADLAARPAFDVVARAALHALSKLGDPRASRMLVDWLKTPDGEDRAPMILTALGSCGDAEAAEYIASRLPSAGARRAFYEVALAEIRTRLATG